MFSDTTLEESDVDELLEESDVDELDLSTSFFMDNSDIDGSDVDRTVCDLTPTPNLASRNPGCFSKPLYAGAPPDLTEYTGYLLIFQYSVKHSLTGKALEEMLHLMATFLPSDSNLPKSVRQLKKFFLDIYSDQHPVMQNYCSSCHQLLEKEESCVCEAGSSQFVTVPIGPQLKARLEGTQLVI